MGKKHAKAQSNTGEGAPVSLPQGRENRYGMVAVVPGDGIENTTLTFSLARGVRIVKMTAGTGCVRNFVSVQWRGLTKCAF